MGSNGEGQAQGLAADDSGAFAKKNYWNNMCLRGVMSAA
jgi:hypothetical protein